MNESLKLGLLTLLGITVLGGSALPYYNEYLQMKSKEETVHFEHGNFDYSIYFRCRGWETLGWEGYFSCGQLKNITETHIEPQYEGLYPKEEFSASLQAKMDCMGNFCVSFYPEIKAQVWELYQKEKQ
ncbi:MAG: hypothetical protein Q8R18_05710 [bacterium]|nr:hypothetical protein [bacterium]